MYGKYAYSVSMRKLFLIVLVIISAAILNASEAGDNFMESLAIAGYTPETVHEEESGITTSIGAGIGYYGGYRMPGYMRLGVTFIQGFAERGETMLGFRLDGSAYTYGLGKRYPGYDIAASFYSAFSLIEDDSFSLLAEASIGAGYVRREMDSDSSADGIAIRMMAGIVARLGFGLDIALEVALDPIIYSDPELFALAVLPALSVRYTF